MAGAPLNPLNTARIQIPRLLIIYRDFYRMQPMYRFMMKWLQENEFYDLKGNQDEESMEILYFQRDGTMQRANEREVWFWWRTIKHFSGRSRWIEHHLDINFNAIQVVDHEMLIEGKKQKVQFGEIRMTIEPYLQVGKFGSHSLLKYIDQFFRTRIWKRDLEEHKKMIYQDAYEFQNDVKNYLELKSFLPRTEEFHKKMEFI